MFNAYLLFFVLIIMIGLFIWGYWRHDVVALIALIALVIFGVIPTSNAFIGFSNPAVITVACVMIITFSITQSGIVEKALKPLTSIVNNATLHLAALCMITAILSAFMNNVGALALMMPITIQTAIKNGRSPSLVLMPLSFASVLGGLSTAIGTPPNLLISAYREQITGHPYSMFDFSPVGVFVAIAAIFFIVVFGWRLIPHRERKNDSEVHLFEIKDYISEVKIPENSPFIDKRLEELENLVEDEFNIIGIIRGRKKILALSPDYILYAKDILIVQANHETLQRVIEQGKLELVGGDIVSPQRLSGAEIKAMEVVVSPGSRIEGRSWKSMRLKYRFRMNLLAIAREGKAFKNRLNEVNLRAGDIVLIQCDTEGVIENFNYLGLVPLAERDIQVGFRHKALIPIGIFSGAILLAAFGVLAVQISFAAAVILLILVNAIPIRKVYTSIDWSIIVLLAALIPIGQALQTSGGTLLIANFFTGITGQLSPIFIVALLLIITMTLSDIMNNAATAVVMSPIAVTIAQMLDANIDTFLMAVAIGASCSFLTPISHQNNTLVMGPGGYKFLDYLRLGLPVELIVVIVAVPLIMIVWPV